MMHEWEKRNIVCKIAWSYLGTWYQWGGDDPGGFDCSGLVIECLKSTGDLPRSGDWRARDLYKMFKQVSREFAQHGDLVFWANSQGIIIHVEIMLNNVVSIGASGGGSKTINYQKAKKENAFIKIRPVDSRKGLFGFINPYQKRQAT